MPRDYTPVIKIFDLVPLTDGKRILSITFPSEPLSPTYCRLFWHTPNSCKSRNHQIFYPKNDVTFCITQIQKQLDKNKATLMSIAVHENAITIRVKT